MPCPNLPSLTPLTMQSSVSIILSRRGKDRNVSSYELIPSLDQSRFLEELPHGRLRGQW